MNGLTCREVEILLAEYIEAALGLAERQSVASHLEGCAACQAEVEDMRLAFHVSRTAAPLQDPVGLVARILEQTSGLAQAEVAPARGSLGSVKVWWRQMGAFFRPVLQPRLVMGLAMALISTSLVLNLAGIDVRRVELSDLNPANLYWKTNQQMHLAAGRISKTYLDLRVVYEIQTQLQALRDETAPPEAPPSGSAPDSQAPAKVEPKKDNTPQPEAKPKQLNRKWSGQFPVMAMAVPLFCK